MLAHMCKKNGKELLPGDYREVQMDIQGLLETLDIFWEDNGK